MESHTSATYKRGDSPYEVNEAYQPASRGPTAPALNTADPSYEDHDLDANDEGGYSSVNTGSPQGIGGVTQTKPELSLDHDLYTAVDDPSIPVSAPAASVQGDEYAVVNKPRKTKTKPQFQPGVYGQVNKPRPIPGGDVYAQVDKPAKRTVADTGDDNYAVVQKPKPGLKSKPTCAVKPNPRDTSGSRKSSGGDGEYNVLRFQGHNSDTPASTDTEQFYSRITSE
ncbi:hypothetical protein BaRGS_00036291 [Batillaria attramentaria]|uniref:Uncharacterized protein n=1 Tax=Batillaria attramentaria TaxID=370345 RepID=A0ABD0JBX4_9CAEN